MKPTYNKGFLYFLIFIVICLFAFLIFLVYIKREYNVAEEQKSTTTSTTTTMPIKQVITLNETTLEDLNLNLDNNFDETYQINIQGNTSDLRIQNEFTETPNTKTNHLSFYLNNELCQELNQTYNKNTNVQNLNFNYLSIYNNEYLVIDYTTQLDNSSLEEEYVYFYNEETTLNLKSLKYDNFRVTFNESRIYYYSDNTGSYDLNKEYTNNITNNTLQVSEYYLEIQNNEFTNYTETNNTTTITL